MPKRRTFIGLAIAALLIGALCLLLWLLPKEEESDEPTEPPQILFDSNDADAVDAFSFACGDNQALAFSRIEDSWQLDGHPNLPITHASVDALLSKLDQMLALRTITESCEDLSEYGLDAPFCTVKLTSDGGEKRYLFGSYNEHYAGYYCVIAGENAVYMVEEDYVEQFDLTLEDLLGSDLLPDLGSPRSIEWCYPDGSSRTDSPDSEAALLLASLELGKWIDYGSEQLAVYGLNAPTVVKLTLWDGAPLTLSFSRGETEAYIYLRIGESEMIYLAACDNLALLGKYIEGAR